MLIESIKKTFLISHDGSENEEKFQTRVLLIMHLFLIVMLLGVVTLGNYDPGMGLMMRAIIFISALSIIFLRFGQLTTVTVVTYTGIGLLATLIVFNREVYHNYETYMLATMHIFIILISSLLTYQRFYTILTTILGVFYIIMLLVFRGIPLGLEDSILELDDYLVTMALITMSGIIVGRTVARRKALLKTAALEAAENEAKAMQLNKSLEEQIKLEAQLRQSQKLEAIGTMVGGISHELNNVLQGMYLYGSMIAEELPENSTVQSHMNHLFESGDRAKEIIKQILTFSRKSGISMEPQPLCDLVSEAMALVKITLPPSIELQQDIDMNCGMVLGDKTQIHQIVINLCNNAQHAMRAEGGVLKVKVQRTRGTLGHALPESDLLKFSVSDTGHGIQSDDLERIFDPFFTTKEFGQGTGLGLSVIHGIVDMMDGEIHASSKVGEGTTITILFPVTSNPQEAKTGEDLLVTSTEPKHILLVDDEETIRVTIGTILSRTGFKIDEALNGQEALALFQKHAEYYDVVVTDLSMPEMSGVELAEAIRETGSDIPIILSTGELGVADKSEYKDSGISNFIQKPWTPTELIEMIKETHA